MSVVCPIPKKPLSATVTAKTLGFGSELPVRELIVASSMKKSQMAQRNYFTMVIQGVFGSDYTLEASFGLLITTFSLS
jgi:hypothetical protein